MTDHDPSPIDFDAFWASPARERWSSVADVDRLASLLARACGGGPLLDVGCGSGALLAAWRARGLIAHGVDRSAVAAGVCNRSAPGSVTIADASKLPFEAASFDTVLCCGLAGILDRAAFSVALREMSRVARHAVVVIAADLAQAFSSDVSTAPSRAEIDAAAFACGLRRHPMELQVVSYDSLELDPAPRVMIYEPIPAPAAARFTQDWLERERDLRMDHARDSGRRADAHLARYAIAARWVRRGDRVLDAACGLGYGSRLLAVASGAASVLGVDASAEAIEYAVASYASSRVAFVRDDAAALSSLQPESVDFIACFETLEHVADPRAMLARFREALSPGGRLIVSVPNNWADDSGKDPNPHHLHVYTRERLLAELGAGFIVEELSLQDAGGGWKSQGRSRRLAVAPREGETPEAEWWIAVAMKSPVGAARDGFRERMFPEQPSNEPAYNLYRFERDYDNPALFRSMICMGPRLSDEAALVALATTVLREARPGSPDQGAAACVLAHQSLKSANASVRIDALAAIDAFSRVNDGSPHAVRWVISGEYVAAMLLLSNGDVEGAVARFSRCASMDAAAFSPLLGTKTVDAACRAGVLLASLGRLDEARASWIAGVREARRLVGGSWLNVIGEEARPQPYGLFELAQVLDAASHCSGWLQTADRLEQQPGFAWAEATRQTFGDVRQYVKDLLAAKQWLESRLAVDDQRHATEARIAAMAKRHAEERAWLESQVAGFRAAEAAAIAAFEQTRAWSIELEQAKQWLESERGRLGAEVTALRTQLEGLQRSAAAIEEARAWQAAQAANWIAEAQTGRRSIEELRAAMAKVEEGRDWHAGQAEAWRTEAQGRQRVIEELREAMAKVEEGRDWHAGQAEAWKAEADARAEVVDRLTSDLTASEQAARVAAAERDARGIDLESLRVTLASLEASLAAHRRRGLIDRLLNRDPS